MRFSTSYVSFALVLITSVAAVPLPFEDGVDNGLVARQEDFQFIEARGHGHSKEEVTDKERKDGKPPKYKKAEKKQPPKYDPAGHQQLDFHSEHDPNAGQHRKDGSSATRDFIEEYLESRGHGSSKEEVTDKERKDGKPPKYKKAEKKQPPKYDPAGHQQLDFHSEHDPNAGQHRKDGSHATRNYIEEYFDARGLFDKKGKGKDTGEVTDKARKDGKPPKYKDVEKKQPPKYDPAGHQQLDFHSEHDPNAGQHRKDGSHATRGLFDKKGKGKDTGEVTDKARKDGKPPKYKDVEKKQPPKYDPAGHQQLDFHSEHDPHAGQHRKDGSSATRDFIEEFLESRGLFDKKGKGKDTGEVTDKERKDGKPPKYKDVVKKQPPKYDPAGHQQLDFHSEHDPNAGQHRKDGSHATRELVEAYLNARGLYMDEDLD